MRDELLALLEERAYTLKELVDVLQVNWFKVRDQVGYLEAQKVVVAGRRGREVVVRLRKPDEIPAAPRPKRHRLARFDAAKEVDRFLGIVEPNAGVAVCASCAGRFTPDREGDQFCSTNCEQQGPPSSVRTLTIGGVVYEAISVGKHSLSSWPDADCGGQKNRQSPVCWTCHRAARANTASRFSARFWSKVQKAEGEACWLWTAAVHSGTGYGMFSVSRSIADGAHRVAWRLTNGEIPDGQWVLHRCDNPRCVRPDHLFLGTHDDNMADMVSKGRGTTANRGEGSARARLTEEDVREIRRLSATGFGLSELGKRFGVPSTTISAIVHRYTWKHVP